MALLLRRDETITILVITIMVRIMKTQATTSPERFLPLKPRVLLMLLALLKGQSHGYALKEEIAARSDGRVALGPGTLYRTIRDLLRDGFIEEVAERPVADQDDERRRYYRITDLGRGVVAAEAQRLEVLVEVVRGERLIP